MGRRLSGNIGTPVNASRINLAARTSAGDAPATGRAAMEVVNGRLVTRMPAEAAKGYGFNGEAQPLARWLVADATALAALIVTSADVGYVARQAAPLAFYRLASTGPAVWELVGGGAAGGGTRTRGTYAARPGTPAVGDVYEVTDMELTELRCFVAGTWEVYYAGVRVQPIAASALGNSHNMTGTTWENQGPYARLIAQTGTGNAFGGVTKSRSHSAPYYVEAGWCSPGGFGLVLMRADGTVTMLNDGDGNSSSGYRVQVWNSSFGFVESLHLRDQKGIGPTFMRAHVVDSSTVHYEYSHDLQNWRRVGTNTAGNSGATADRVGYGYYRTTGVPRTGLLVHFREYAA